MKLTDIVARRLRTVRLEIYGEHGLPLLAEALDIPARNWARYESGESMPGVVLLRFIDIARVEPQWLLSGQGQRYRVSPKAGHCPWNCLETGQRVRRLDPELPAQPET
jgi:hypothetical protein